MRRRQWIFGAALVAALAVPAVLHAHGGHTHKVMGTVAGVQGDHVQIKTTDGKMVTVMLDAKTTIMQGKIKLDRAALKDGVRVSIDAMEEKGMTMAQAVRLGVAPLVIKHASKQPTPNP